MTQRERSEAPQQLEVSGEGMAVAAALGERLSHRRCRSSSSTNSDAAADETGADASSSSVGSALIIDYGRLSPPYGDSLVAIKDHLPVADVLSSAGLADLSARVDFGALAAAAVAAGRRRRATKRGTEAGGTETGAGGGEADSSSSSIATYGPIPQSTFLRGLGIAARLESLVAAAEERSRKARDKKKGGDNETETSDDDGDDDLERTVDALVEGARRLVAPDSEGGLGDTYQAMVIAPAGRAEPPVPFG